MRRRALQHELERLLDTVSVIGLSRVCDRLSALPDALQQARQAAQVVSSGLKQSRIAEFEELSATASSPRLELGADVPLVDKIATYKRRIFRIWSMRICQQLIKRMYRACCIGITYWLTC